MVGPVLMIAAMAAATPAIVAQAGPHVLVAGPVVKQAFVYGSEQRQYLELFTREKAGRGPVVVYLHGGGWSAGSPKDGSAGAQADFYTSRGYAYAGVAYRYVPAVTLEQQLADVARGIAYLRKQKGVDPGRVVLIGHSSGGHLAALLGTDPSYLQAAGVPFAALKAVVLLDPAALDVPPIMAGGAGGAVSRYYVPAFGTDPARQSALSPMKQVEAPNAPAWLMLHDANNGLAGAQSQDLKAGLLAAGAVVDVQAITGTDHMRLNGEIGRVDDKASDLIAAFLASVFPENQRARFR